jgi:hypothetical protein
MNGSYSHGGGLNFLNLNKEKKMSARMHAWLVSALMVVVIAIAATMLCLVMSESGQASLNYSEVVVDSLCAE